MTVLIEPKRQAVIMDEVSWDYYSQTLAVLGPSRGKRITYDRGRMEIVTTSNEHERAKQAIHGLIEQYCIETRTQFRPEGSLTLRRQLLARGLEPDNCYYIQTPAPPTSSGEFDLDSYPPPDLAVEVEVSTGSIAKLPIYGALGVREVWRYAGDQVSVWILMANGQYQERADSVAFPRLSIADLNRFMRQAMEGSYVDALLAFRDWVHAHGR